MAVSEIVALMNRAKRAQVDLKFELIFDYEILRLQTRLILCHIFANQSEFMGFYDTKKTHRWKRLRNGIEDFFTNTTYIDKENFESADKIEDKDEKQIKILVEIKDKLMHPNKFEEKTKQSDHKKHMK